MNFFLIILQVIGVLTLVPWFMAAGLSFLAFDTRRAIKKMLPWVVILFVFSYPFVLGGLFWKAWESYHEGVPAEPIIFSIMPTLLFMIFYLLVKKVTNYYDELKAKRR